MRSKILAITLAAVLVMLSASGCGSAAQAAGPALDASPVPKPNEIKAQGTLEPIRFAKISISSDSSVAELLVTEEQLVQAGDVIATLQTSNGETLESARTNAALRMSEAYQAIHDAQDKLDAFNIPAKFATMPAAEAARLALASLNVARAQFEPYKANSVQGYRANNDFPSLPKFIWVDTEYYNKDGVAREYHKQLDNAWVDYRRTVQWMELDTPLQIAKAQLAQAQKDYDSLQDPALAEDTAGARAALANAELRAPFSGTITNLDLKVGQSLTAGTVVATIADFSSWVVKTTDLTEIDVVNMKEGQPVTLTLDALPGVTLKGRVISIAQNYTERQGDIVYKVTVAVDGSNPGFRWGMTAKVHVAK